jgi:SAM-dependent methyltransferase
MAGSIVNCQLSIVNEEEAMTGLDAVFWDELFVELAVVEAAGAEHWIERALPDAAARAALAGRVLELGCGLGYDTRWLVQAGCQVTALDGSAVALYKRRCQLRLQPGSRDRAGPVRP